MTDPIRGLTSEEVDVRIRSGQVNKVPPAPSRTFAEIFRANVFTRFNALMATLAAVVIASGSLRDALFGGVVVANSAIGIAQEVRAKRMLDRLAVLAAPIAHVVRDGGVTELAIDHIVMDDIIELRPGAQVVADAEVATSDALEVDESLLTGEADAEAKVPGDELLSGSFVVSGQGRARVTRVGAEAYAVKLAEEARRFTLANSELRASIDRIVTWVSWALIPAGIGLLWSQLRQSSSIGDALVAAVAGMVGMVPEGLVLLTSVAFAVGVVRLARRRTLVQELAAVETLARVDVICLDKTGTITEGSMVVDGLECVPDSSGSVEEVEHAIGAMAAAEANPNATFAALAACYPAAPGWDVLETVAFSSARKWSAAKFGNQGWFVIGAPEMVLAEADADRPLSGVTASVTESAERGLRVLLVARVEGEVDVDGWSTPPEPLALVTIMDKIRDDAKATLQFFEDQGVAIKVISGDNALTVGAVAERAGLVDVAAVDARALPDDQEALGDAVEAGNVFGRVTPHQKRAMVAALQARGHVVAMTGDGVNDVLALKDSDCGIAMASGSEATRAVAQVVLLDSSFAGLPYVVAEGRRVINNLQRVAALFLTKTTYAVIFAFVTGVLGVPFLLLPRHLTLISTLCVGAPSFLLALAPNTDLVRGNFLSRVARDSMPYGIVTAVATMTVFLVAHEVANIPLVEERTAAVITLAGCSLLVLLRSARPLVGWKLGLVVAMAAAMAGVFALPATREFFELQLPPTPTLTLALGAVGMAGAAMALLHRVPFLRVDEPAPDAARSGAA